MPLYSDSAPSHQEPPMNSTVNLTLDDYNALQLAKVTAENEAASLRKQLADAKLDVDSSGIVRKLTTAARDMLHVVRFAVANCPPETVHGWPFDKLVEISRHIEALPDATSDDVSFAIELQKFAFECKKIELQRQIMKQKQVIETVDMTKGGIS